MKDINIKDIIEEEEFNTQDINNIDRVIDRIGILNILILVKWRIRYRITLISRIFPRLKLLYNSIEYDLQSITQQIQTFFHNTI